MSTRSTISIKTSKTGGKTIYCHWDGYPEHNGKLLVENYSTPAAITELMLLGDLSNLDLTPAKCKAYHRDRNEPWGMVEPRDVNASEMASVGKEYGVDYVYIYNNEFEWECFDYEGNPVEILSELALN